MLANVFALYLETEILHWHMGGPHFRDCHDVRFAEAPEPGYAPAEFEQGILERAGTNSQAE